MEFYFPLLCSVLFVPRFNSQRDGILRFCADSILSVRCQVSIPNGMEFYFKRRFYRLSCQLFQFPTGWNSTHRIITDGANIWLFQFPTGWNSTLWCSRYRSYTRVSIPNGIEFYQTTSVELWSALQSFNSQRDGILHCAYRVYHPRIVVFQFPTGWNSTVLYVFVEQGKFSFNSQRDGILLSWCYYGRRWIRFQFPTGWNSTLFKPSFSLSSLVSIPNGMEFYWARERSGASRKSFNSQRDGILLSSAVFGSVCSSFQFPTGWNSTGYLTPAKIEEVRFNSQRDGILHKEIPTDMIWSIKFQFPTGWNSTLASYQMTKRLLVSIPNGMEFYQKVAHSATSIVSGFNSQRDGILQHEFCHFSR